MLRETITIFSLIHHVKIFYSAGTCKRSFVISNQIWIITFQEIKISISIFNDKLYYTAKYLTSVMISYIRKAGLEIMRGFLWEGEAIYFRDHNTWGHLSGLVSVAVPCVHGLWYKCIIYLSESMKHSHQFPVIFFLFMSLRTYCRGVGLSSAKFGSSRQAYKCKTKQITRGQKRPLFEK